MYPDIDITCGDLQFKRSFTLAEKQGILEFPSMSTYCHQHISMGRFCSSSSRNFSKLTRINVTSEWCHPGFYQKYFWTFLTYIPHIQSSHTFLIFLTFSHTFLTYIPHMHSSHAFLTCIPHMHSSHAFLTCIPHMHSSHAFLTCIPHMHSSHAFLTCIPHMHSSHAFLTCIPHMHSSHAFLTCIPHMHSSHAFIPLACLNS